MTEQEFGCLQENTLVYNTVTNTLYRVCSWFYPHKTIFTGTESLWLSSLSLSGYTTVLSYKELSLWEIFDSSKAPIEVRVTYLEYQLNALQQFVYDRLH